MPSYLIQLAYTPEAWAAMVKQPQNRLEAVRPIVEKLGGKFEHAWLAFGEYDIVGVVEMPENIDAAAFAMAVAAGGAAKAFKTTPLLSVEEGVEAMRKAQGAGYRLARRLAARQSSTRPIGTQLTIRARNSPEGKAAMAAETEFTIGARASCSDGTAARCAA